jgi:DNA-binding MarR family transcriptional regulator
LTDLIVPTIRLHGMFSRAGEEIAKPAGQTLARWLALEEVADGPATVAQMARALGLARQSVQRVTDLLERDRLIEYSANPEHQRAQLVRLTPDGRRAMHTIREAQRTWADAIGAQVGEAELRQAGATVNRLLEVLAQQLSRGRGRP